MKYGEEYQYQDKSSELEKAGSELIRSLARAVPAVVIVILAWEVFSAFLATPVDCSCHPIKVTKSKQATYAISSPNEATEYAPSKATTLSIERLVK